MVLTDAQALVGLASRLPEQRVVDPEQVVGALGLSVPGEQRTTVHTGCFSRPGRRGQHRRRCRAGRGASGVSEAAALREGGAQDLGCCVHLLVPRTANDGFRIEAGPDREPGSTRQ